jgi:hypothetical protein
VSLKWTLLFTFADGVLLVAAFVFFEVSVRPSPSQRQRVANEGWAVAGLLVVALWAWFLACGKRSK